MTFPGQLERLAARCRRSILMELDREELAGALERAAHQLRHQHQLLHGVPLEEPEAAQPPVAMPADPADDLHPTWGAGPCAVEGCERHAGVGRLMCARHWLRVPLERRRAVSRAWSRWNADLCHLGELRDAQAAAVAAVSRPAG